jgi:hypothetical protein
MGKTMQFLIGVGGLLLLLLVLVDGFETMVLPRRVAHAFRITRLFYRHSWPLWRFLSQRFPKGRRREGFLSVFGPLSLFGLLVAWVLGLILGFAMLYWAWSEGINSPDPEPDFGTYLYMSGTTFFTLGYGDVTPRGNVGRALAVVEAGGGFAFLALIIGYLPVLYQAFSRREATISLLDARAGSPPSAGQCLLRVARSGNQRLIDSFLAEWERWSAELLESHLSFPFLTYFRSQHDNQSWLATLTFILDCSALVIATGKGPETAQARLTFAMARHAAVDLALIFRTPPRAPTEDRLPLLKCHKMRGDLADAGLPIHVEPVVDAKLEELRALYEPFVQALGDFFVFPLPVIWSDKQPVDNWQTSAWTNRTPGLDELPPIDADNHPLE